MVTASGVLTGPLGNQFDVSRRDSAIVLGDPIATVSLGKAFGKTSVDLTSTTNIPAGNYRNGSLANVSFNRWIEDVSLAVSWHAPDKGWDVTGKIGYTYNWENHATDYKSGQDIHVEASVERLFSKAFSLGALGYYYDQITGDSGSGAVLGSFEGRVVGMGGTAAYNLVMGRSPATIRLRVLEEFDAKRRLEGTGIFLSLSLPLKMNIPAGAH
jgi:hypothetical protein